MNDHAGSRAKPRSLEFFAALIPDRVALSEGHRSLSWAEWNAQADRLAEALHQHGVGPGSFVAVCMQNRLEWFVTQAATAKLGAILVPIAFRLTPAEVHYIVADSGARAFLFDAEDVDAMARVWTNDPPCEKRSNVAAVVSVLRSNRSGVLSFTELTQHGEQVPRFAQSAPRSIVYTSGTTGRPRGVVSALPKAAPKPAKPAAPRPQLTAADLPREIERNLLGAPLNHAAGQASARATLSTGGCVYILPRFDAEQALKIIDREKITNTFLVPTMLNRIVNLPKETLARYDVSSIKVITTGASPCPQSVKEQVIAYFGTCLFESYGSTEVGLVTSMLPQDHLAKPGSCGKIRDGVEVKIVDPEGRSLPQGSVGEIWVKTPFMIEKYLNEPPPKELIDGFFATGDVGRFDEDGYLYILDRKKDMIIAGGVNIYPAEIENALRRHPAVLDAAVFGIPHAEWGEEVKAVVECVDGKSVQEAELLEFVSSELAGYKRPRSIEFLSEIPRNAAGKILKTQLRAPYWAETGKAI